MSKSINRRRFLKVLNQGKKVNGLVAGDTFHVTLEFKENGKQAHAFVRKPNGDVFIGRISMSINLRDIARAIKPPKKSHLDFTLPRCEWLAHVGNRKSVRAARQPKFTLTQGAAR